MTRLEWLEYNKSVATKVPLPPYGVYGMALTGSRVICDPWPTDTDLDVLLCVEETELANIEQFYLHDGWTPPASYAEYSRQDASDTLLTFRKMVEDVNVNLIIVGSVRTFSHWITATGLAQRLNLLNKQDRVALFAAILNRVRAACIAEEGTFRNYLSEASFAGHVRAHHRGIAASDDHWSVERSDRITVSWSWAHAESIS